MVPTTGQYGFDIADDEIEIGVGIHGEKDCPGKNDRSRPNRCSP